MMNNSDPDWRSFGSDTCVTNQKKHMGLDHELVELLWQNGQVVLQSQTNRKPVMNSITSREVHKSNHSTERSSEPFGCSSNLIQDDETVSWIHYPLEDSLEQELCSSLLSELPHCEVESYNQINQFEEGKFSKSDASNSSSAHHVTVVSPQQPLNMKPSFVHEFSGIATPDPRFHVPDSSKRNNDYSRSGKVLNFSHFSAFPNVSSATGNANFREKTSGNNMSKGEVRECSGMTVGSSYCGSNQIPQEQDVSKASSNGIWTEVVRDDLHKTIIPQTQSEKGKSEMLEPALTSSSGGSGSTSLGKTCSLSTRSQGQKRKGIEVDESVEQSEDTELKSAEGNKASKRGGSGRRNRAAEVHNLSERRRRDRINEKMKALQQLIPHSSKTDKASMLEEAIEYLKSLQLQLQVMWMGSSMAPMMIPGIHNYMQQMGMGMATPFPHLQNPMQLPRAPIDQSTSASQTPNQTLLSQNPMLNAFNYQNQMQNPALSEQYARYMGYHLMQNACQPMNMYRYGHQAVQHIQTAVPPSNSSGPLSGAANIENAVNGKMGGESWRNDTVGGLSPGIHEFKS